MYIYIYSVDARSHITVHRSRDLERTWEKIQEMGRFDMSWLFSSTTVEDETVAEEECSEKTWYATLYKTIMGKQHILGFECDQIQPGSDSVLTELIIGRHVFKPVGFSTNCQHF